MAGLLFTAAAGRVYADMCDLTTSRSSCGSALGPSYSGLRAIFQQLDVSTNPRQFFLDVQESSTNPQISLDRLQVFLSNTGTEIGYANGRLNGMSPIYDLDNGMDQWIKLDAVLNPTGSTGDLIAFIPDSLFTGTNPYVYVYAQFGKNVAVDGSFEEWWGDSPLSPQRPVPEPTGLVLLGSGLVVAARSLRRARRDSSAGETAQTKVADSDEFQRQIS